MRRLAMLVLAAAALGLGWALRLQLLAPDPAPAPITAGASGVQGLDAGPSEVLPTMVALAALTETVERPLFRADCRPPPADAGPAVPDAPVAPLRGPAAVLTGVFIVAGEPVALLRAGSNAATTRARIGDSVDGWEVVSIGAEEVALRQGASEHVLELRRFEPGLPVAPLPGAARPEPAPPADGDDALRDPDAVDPADVRRPRRPLRGPRQAARERVERREGAAPVPSR